MEARTVQATSLDETGWSLAALKTAFGALLWHWMRRRLGVPPGEVEDAVQDALMEAWRDVATFPADRDKARFEMFRVASRVAQRYRRKAARVVCVEALEVRDTRDAEADIAARAVWKVAWSRLDKRSRDLLHAYHIKGQTHKQIGADLGEKEDTIRKRVDVAEEKLRKEIEKLIGKEHEYKGLFPSGGLVIVFDPFDRETIQAIWDVDEEFALDGSPASSVRPKVKTNSWPWQCVPMGVLAAALFLVPGQGWRTEPLHAEKMARFALPMLTVPSDVPSMVAPLPRTPEPLPRKTERRDRHTRPVLSDEDAALVKTLRSVGSSRGP